MRKPLWETMEPCLKEETKEMLSDKVPNLHNGTLGIYVADLVRTARVIQSVDPRVTEARETKYLCTFKLTEEMISEFRANGFSKREADLAAELASRM
jgi:hypothetical protein